MAQFRATIEGQRGEASRLGNRKSGIQARVNGWSGGVRVEGHAHESGDQFRVFATNGSGGGENDGYLGCVRDGKFTPSDALRSRIIEEYRETLRRVGARPAGDIVSMSEALELSRNDG